jgi:hypothetical protein
VTRIVFKRNVTESRVDAAEPENAAIPLFRRRVRVTSRVSEWRESDRETDECRGQSRQRTRVQELVLDASQLLDPDVRR